MDISIISGQLALLHVKLEPGDGFEVYGGTSEDGLRVERQGDSEWLVTLDEQDVAGRPLVRYNVYARQLASGREWAILGGKIMVSQRTATVPGDKLAPVEYFVTVPVVENAVDLTGTALVTGIVGPRGYSAYEVAVLEGFEGSEAEWLEWIRQQTATKAVEQVEPFAERAERAVSDTTEHARQTEQNKLAAGNAAASATASAEAAQQAKADAEAAQQEAAADATAAGNAAASATASAEAAQQAKADAGLAKDGAEAARDGAQAAKDDAVLAAAEAKAARDGAQVAQAGAEAAQVAADDAAGVAAGSAEAAVVAAAEAKAAEAGAAGAADAVRFDLLPLTLDWLEGRLEKMYGAGMCSLALAEDEGSLRVAFSLDMGTPQVEETGALLDRVLPRNLVTEMEWAGGLPLEYTPIEYLESTGTQFIDTGILPNGRYKVNFSVLSKKWDGYSNSNPVFFAYESGLWFFYSLNWQGIYDSAGQRGYGYQRYSLKYPPMHELDVKYDVVLDGATTIRNGIEVGSIGGTFVAEDFQFSRITILLFNRTDVKTQPTSKVLYSFSIEDNGIPVVNYIPALNPEGQPGLYDTVSKAFKVNIGTGDFLYPGKEEEATTYSLRRRDYAKLTEHGVRRLYHVPKGCTLSKEEYAEENGFKVLVETPMPEEGYWEPIWHEREDCIELEWVETEPPIEETLTETE